MINKILNDNSARGRLLRTIIQGVLGVLIANLDFFVAALSFSAEGKAIIVACAMAILSPVMAELGKYVEEE